MGDSTFKTALKTHCHSADYVQIVQARHDFAMTLSRYGAPETVGVIVITTINCPSRQQNNEKKTKKNKTDYVLFSLLPSGPSYFIIGLYSFEFRDVASVCRVASVSTSTHGGRVASLVVFGLLFSGHFAVYLTT